MAARETVLYYYSPGNEEKVRRVKSVLVRLGIRIKNITLEQFGEQVGTLSGLVAFPGKWETDRKGQENSEKEQLPADPAEEVLVLCNFTTAALDGLFRELRKCHAEVALKAVLTETNQAWTFSKLYEEVRREHEALTKGKEKSVQN